MSLIVACSKCGKKYKVGDDKAGKKIKCAGCGAIIAIPAAAEGEVDVWDLPPAEDSSAPPLPPLPSRGGSKKTGAKKSSRKSNGGSSTLKIVLIIFGVIGGITALGCGGCYLVAYLGVQKLDQAFKENAAKDPSSGSNPNATPPSGTPQASATPPASMETATPVAKLEASGMMSSSDFRQYENQVVEITGVCTGYYFKSGAWRMNLSKPVIHPEKGESHFGGCGGYLLKNQKDAWTKVVPEQKVTLRGFRKAGSDDDLLLIDCVILNVEGPRCHELTAKEYAKEADALSNDDFSKKYNLKFGILSGVVAEVRREGGLFDVMLTDHGKLPVKMSMSPSEAPCDSKRKKVGVDPASIKPGDRIKSFGIMGAHSVEAFLIVDMVISVESGSSPSPQNASSASSATQFAEKDLQTAEGKQTWQGLQGKTVEFTGVVTVVDQENMVRIGKSTCVLDRKEVPVWRKLLPGQTATIRGTAGDPKLATLMGGTIVKVEGKPGPEFTVEEVERILREDTDPKKKNALQKLGGDDKEVRIVFRGKVEKVNMRSGFVDFSSSSKARINVSVFENEEHDKADLERCKVGDTIRAVGRLTLTPDLGNGSPMATLAPGHIVFDK